jgi:hypothetical protein
LSIQKNPNADGEDESDEEEDDEACVSICTRIIHCLTRFQHSSGLSKLEFELARFRGLLEKRYANDHDSGYTYINPVSSEAIPLTPFMMKEWARAMVSILILK